MINVLIGLTILLLVLVVLQFYYSIQYIRKKNDRLTRSYVIDTYLNRGIALSFITLPLLVVISVLQYFI